MNTMFYPLSPATTITPPSAAWRTALPMTGAAAHRFAVPLALGLLGASLTFRLLWLDRLPGINGDEAWYGVQALRFLSGQPWSIQTPTGLPTNPLLFLTESLLLCLFEPSFWVLRMPIAIWAGAGLAITYHLHRWVYGSRIEALILTTLTACLPGHLAYSRFCWDASFAFVSLPLVIYPLLKTLDKGPSAIASGLLGIGCLLAIWIHATHVVLVLAAGLALAWQWRTRIAASFRSKPITCGVATAAVVCVTAWLGGESHQTRILLESVSSSPERLPRHLAGLADVLMGNRVYEYLSGLPPPDWIVWVRPAWYAAAALLLFLLIKFGRNPDRIMACLTIVIFCLLLLAGRMLRLHRASYERYILYLVPLSGVILVRGLTAASHWFRPFFRGPSRKCLLGEMDGDCPSSGRAQPTRTRASNELDGASPVFQGWTHLLPLGLSVILLVQFWCSYFVPLLGQTCAATLHRTFRSGLEEPKAELAAAIRKRLTQTDSVVIVAEDWWIHHAVEFLLAGRHAVHSDVEPEQAVEARFVAGFAESSFVREVRTSAVARRTLQEELHFGRSSGDPVLTLLVCEPTTEKREPQPD